MKRGEIWWASMRAPRGSEPGYRRPVVIIQSNDFNQSRIGTVIVAVITTNLQLADAPGNFLIGGKSTGLKSKSVVNVSQLVTISKDYLSERIGRLNNKHLFDIDEGIKLVLSL
ncbi:MAG: type II toxin-antitoxin system PemK/MazF family toxin [Proteobacteria bacterium]|nr:type II toxin-antitoxin system PemK/MazF family toxin [Pseudomonadota bacterium]